MRDGAARNIKTDATCAHRCCIGAVVCDPHFLNSDGEGDMCSDCDCYPDNDDGVGDAAMPRMGPYIP